MVARHIFAISRAGLSLIVAGALGACAFPAREPIEVPEPGVIRLQADANGEWHAVAPDCTRLLVAPRLPTWRGDRPTAAFGCATYTNLARQLARPEDLEAPRPYAGQDPTTAAGAIERYHDNAVTPLNDTSTRTTADSGSGGL